MVLALSFAGIDLGLPPLLKPYLFGNGYLLDIVAGGTGALVEQGCSSSEQPRPQSAFS
jgi:hypothetical protein